MYYQFEEFRYSPFIDEMVPFAYNFKSAIPGQIPSTNITEQEVNEFERKFLALFPEEKRGREILQDSKNRIIVYPSVEDKSNERFHLAAKVQYIIQVENKWNSNFPNWLKRVHPGSPHMYWRHLWLMGSDLSNANTNVVDIEIQNRAIAISPLEEEKKEINIDLDKYHLFNRGRVKLLPLTNISVGETIIVDVRLVVPDNSTIVPRPAAMELVEGELGGVVDSNVYCGDILHQWEESYTKDLAGTYSKCRKLYNQETDVGLRLFGSRNILDKGKIFKEIPMFIQVINDRDLSSERDKIANLQSSYGKEREKLNELKNFLSLNMTFGKKQDLEYENLILDKHVKYLQSKIEDAKTKYQSLEKELYELTRKPFLRI